jgi:hypothetical protein
MAMQATRLAQISFATGAASICFFAVFSVLLAIYPPAAGHKSALFSEVGGVLLLLSAVSGVLAPVALVTGIKALRRFLIGAARKDKLMAWVGVGTGGAYTAMMVLPFLLLLVSRWKQ